MGGDRMGRRGADAGPGSRGRPRPGHDVRLRALRALLAVERSGMSSQAAVREALDGPPPLQGPDRGLATALIYGSLRRQRRLDRWIGGASDRGLAGLDEEVLAALRLGAMQLAFMERVPAFAAIDATVEAAGAVGGRKKKGFVNGVLRRLARERPWAREDEGGEGDLPPWLRGRLARFAGQVGRRAETMIEAFEGEAPLHVHALPRGREATVEGLRAAGLVLRPVLGVPGVFEVQEGEIFGTDAFARRRLLARDGASGAVVQWAGIAPGERVADIAAGRGAKSVFFASAGGRVTAVDLQADKLDEARALARCAGTPLEATIVADASQPLPLPPGTFDVVVLDAPCTGLGTLRRRPEIRHRRGAADILRMAWLQARMLRGAAALVRPGGRLVYATCSFAEEEGPAVVDAFLEEHPAFVRASPRLPWVSPLLDRRGDLRTHPLLDGVDAFYAASLRRA